MNNTTPEPHSFLYATASIMSCPSIASTYNIIVLATIQQYTYTLFFNILWESIYCAKPILLDVLTNMMPWELCTAKSALMEAVTTISWILLALMDQMLLQR